MIPQFLWRDTDHQHQNSMTLGRLPKYFRWTTKDCDTDIVWHTNRMTTKEVDKKRKNYALLIEPRCMMTDVYDAFNDGLIDSFDKVFTHDSKLLKHNNTYWIPGNGVWYDGGLGEKNKLVSMLVSNKRMVYLHTVRHSVAKYLIEEKLADVMGTFVGPPVKTEEAFYNYKYNICMENYIDYSYFTEKLTNCFASMTIPIYFGASEEFLSTKFDTRGIIFVKEPREIPVILLGLTKDDYENRRSALVSNYNIVQNYLCLDDYIYENYL